MKPSLANKILNIIYDLMDKSLTTVFVRHY